MKLATAILSCALLLQVAGGAAAAPERKPSALFEHAIASARDALAKGSHGEALPYIERALERDPKSADAWALKAQWAAAAGERDEQVHALHRQYALLVAQKAPAPQLKKLREGLAAADPIAADLFRLSSTFLGRLAPLAEQYEKERRPHSAIRVLRQMLALDPENAGAQQAIERISALPDPSLAGSAKPKDLLADVSREWIREHDAKHADWKQRAQLERDNYVTHTDAGYEVLVRAAEAMEQMNAFYRRFFEYGGGSDDRSVPRIALFIFKNRDEYLALGSGPPVEWSGGQFTGSTVETYIGQGGFQETVTTLFHEAAHQFVSLATNAAGWLNEGLASFFEGCRILANGTVLMNEPANHRLFPLVARMKAGWMADHEDGLDAGNANTEPKTAPTFRIVLENRYAWGPPWYAPTWGVVYFLYNYQDPADGRFIYRKAFREFVDASGGRMGEGAVENFEKVVLQQPQAPSPGLPSTERLKLPRTVDELNEVWKDWMIALAAEQSGETQVERPYLDWARYALKRREWTVATEHFEKGLVQTPDDVDLLVEFADHLAEHEGNQDRATRLVLDALRVLEAAEPLDDKRARELEARLGEWDGKRDTLESIRTELRDGALAVVDRYLEEKLPLMAMEVSWRLGADLGLNEMFPRFEKALRASGKSVHLWQLAYNESDLDGWSVASPDVWVPYGAELRAALGGKDGDPFAFDFLTYDTVTSGDYSITADVYAQRGESAFCGLVFGRKAAQTFHALVLYPGHEADPEQGRIARGGKLVLTSFFGADSFKEYRSNPVDTAAKGWHSLRIDVVGSEVDVWFDGAYVVTHDFGSVDVLAGSFGLFTGPGATSFRNVRFLARDRRDPGARLERELRMEELRDQAGTGSLNGSWLGREPPFPSVAEWLQEPRLSFADEGPVPTLLLFWSIAQNDALPMDQWLNGLAARHADVGLDVITVAQFTDRAALPEYLKAHPLPGSIAVDRPLAHKSGETFDAYGIRKDGFQLPRIVLLDVDHTVYWEGDPGIEYGKGFGRESASYVDQPLAELAQRRKLADLRRWLEQWPQAGAPALARGDLAAALPYLKRAMELPGKQVPVIAAAQSWFRSLREAVDRPRLLAEAIGAAQADPAAKVLVEWAALLESPFDAERKGAVRTLLAGAAAKDWDKATKETAKVLQKWTAAPDWSAVEALVRLLEPMTGALPNELAAELDAALRARDEAAVRRLLEEAPLRPARWLVVELAE